MKKPNWKEWIRNKEKCKIWLDYYLKKKILKKCKDQSRLYLNKTNHNLNIANWLTEKHKDEIPKMFGKETFYDWIITIFYYSVYHSALALISKEGYESKNHSATLCFLIYHHFHSQKALNEEEVELIATSLKKEDIEIIGTSKELRERACYNVHETFEKELLKNIKEKSINFINKIKFLLE